MVLLDCRVKCLRYVSFPTMYYPISLSSWFCFLLIYMDKLCVLNVILLWVFLHLRMQSHSCIFCIEKFQVILQQRMPKELLQSSLRPILVNLAHTKNLSMPLLQGLARLLELLSNWFNVTLGGKLLEHLKKWLDPEKLALCQKSWKAGEEPKIAAGESTSFFFPFYIQGCLRRHSYTHIPVDFFINLSVQLLLSYSTCFLLLLGNSLTSL